MGLVYSLQGCMAVGKTSAARYLEAHVPGLRVFYEDNASVMEAVRRRGLDKTVYEDYLEIQKLWIARELRRWEAAQALPAALMDLGAEEIEFYTLHYPKSIGKHWEMEAPLAKELRALRRCLPRRILFLDAGDEVLRRRKASDESRSREFFEHTLTTLLPLKRQWFLGRENVDVLRTDGLDREQAGRQAAAWVQAQMKQEAGM